MSCERGNTSRVRRQKHQNSHAFKNTLHDISKRTKMINELEIAEVCKRCQDVINWKVKYKKYKPLSQAKTCTKCHKKTIKDAYHIVCVPCAQSLEICCKCGKKEEIVAHFSPSEVEQMKAKAELQQEVKALPERKRRAYYRYIEKLEGKKKKKKKKPLEDGQTANGDTVSSSVGVEAESDGPVEPLSNEEYLRKARLKLDDLMKGMDDDFFDDLDDLDLSGDDENDEDGEGWEDENDDC